MSKNTAQTQNQNISVFISYSQTPVLPNGKEAPTDVINQHKDWVRSLANRLRGDSIDVILDQTHLRPGQNAVKFMESTVVDENMKKVVIIVDLAYTRKANDGVGGVGTESQIISPEIYENAKQTKYIAVLRQRDEDNKPVLPPWLKTTIWIDMSNDERAEENYESLLRSLADKPLHVPAPLGNLPSFLDSTEPQSPASTKIRSAQSAIQSAKPNATGFVQDALDAIRDDLLARSLPQETNSNEIGKALMAALAEWTPRRDEYLGFIKTDLRYGNGQHLHRPLPQFFQSFLPTISTEIQRESIYESHLTFAVYELWLQTTALLLAAEAFHPLTDLLHARFPCQQHNRPSVSRFTVFRPWDSHPIIEVKNRVDSQKW